MITLFTTPKPFRGHIEVIQRNAIRSWTLLEPRPEVILFGDDEGTAEVAAELGVRHIPAVECSERGTPLISDMFEQAQRLGRHHILAYVNADIILMSDFMPAVSRVAQRFGRFLMIGQRWDCDLRAPLSFGETGSTMSEVPYPRSTTTWEDDLHHLLAERGSLHAVTGIDYFVFTRHLWPHIPPFAVGRRVWDNWLVWAPLSSGKPVIDATRVVTAVHQNHDFGHVAGGWQGKVGGVEAQRNLALGRDCLASGEVIGFTSHASWELASSGLITERRVPIARKPSAPMEMSGKATSTTGGSLAPVEGSIPTLSVCMIVKDEEKLLAQCLDSVTGVADEIIIVDTGSTDRTVEIARQYTDKVYFHEWQNSFSEARNHSLSYATCDRILQIDADEDMYEEDVPILRGALAAARDVPDIDAILVPIFSELPGKLRSKHYFPRIHRRGRAHYEGIVHNQLVYAGNQMIAEIRFRHYGYDLPPEEMERKRRRSEALLLTQIEEDPDNTFAWKNLVRIYRNRREWERVVERGPWVLDHPRTTPEQRHSVASDMMVALTKLGRHEEAEDVGLRALEKIPDNLDIICYLGMGYVASSHLDKAVSRLKQFLRGKRAQSRAEPQFSLLSMEHYASEAAAWNSLGQCYLRQGKVAEAAEAYRRAIESDPDQEGFYTNLAFTLLELGEVAQAEAVLQETVERGVARAAAWHMLGGILYLEHRLLESEAAYRRAIECDEPEADTHLGLGHALIAMRRFFEAVAPLARALELNPQSRKAWLAWVKAHQGLGERDEAVAGLDRLLELGRLQCRENLTLAAISISLEVYDRAAAFLETYLQEKPEDINALADLATCYAKMGRYAAALEGYRAVLHSDPENASVRRNLRALQRRLVRETAVQ